MSYSYIINEFAQKDYETSLKWYAERSNQAAVNFVTEVDKALILICNYPERWRNQYKNFHELTLKKYPFTIVYTIEKDKQLVVITAIFHHKRNSNKKYRK